MGWAGREAFWVGARMGYMNDLAGEAIEGLEYRGGLGGPRWVMGDGVDRGRTGRDEEG